MTFATIIITTINHLDDNDGGDDDDGGRMQQCWQWTDIWSPPANQAPDIPTMLLYQCDDDDDVEHSTMGDTIFITKLKCWLDN